MEDVPDSLAGAAAGGTLEVLAAGAEFVGAAGGGDSTDTGGGAFVLDSGVCATSGVWATSGALASSVAAGEGVPAVSSAVVGACALREPKKCQPAAMATTATTPTVANKGIREEPCFCSLSATSGCAISSFGKRVLLCLIERSAASCAACAMTFLRTHSLGRLGSFAEARRYAWSTSIFALGLGCAGLIFARQAVRSAWSLHSGDGLGSSRRHSW